MQTVNESIDLGAVLAEVGKLGAGIADIASAERELIKNRAERMTAVRREFVQRGETDEEKLNLRFQQIGAERQEKISLAQAAADARAARIHQAYHASKSALADRVQGEKDRRIGLVQGSIMRNRQERQEELAKAKEAHESLLALLAADRKARRELGRSSQSIFRSHWPVLKRRFHGATSAGEVDTSGTADALRDRIQEQLQTAEGAVTEARKLTLVKIFRFLPLWLMMIIVAALQYLDVFRYGPDGRVPFIVLSELVVLGFWLVALVMAMGTIRRLTGALATCRVLEKAAQDESAGRLAALEAEILKEHAAEGQSLGETFRESDSEWKTRLAEGQRDLENQFSHMPTRAERLHQRKLARIEAEHEEKLSQARSESEQRSRQTESARDQLNRAIESNVGGKISALTESWRETVVPVFDSLVRLESRSRDLFPEWTSSACANWTAPDESPVAVRIGELRIDTGKLGEGLPHDERFELPENGRLSVPFALGFPDQGSILIESEGGGEATLALNAIALRLLSAHPPGRSSFVFIDPVGLGKDFAGLMHLADYEEALINHRIWTQGTQIEERLAELNEHIEKVIQMYLRNEYATIAEYNEQAGTIAEKSRFLVVGGFPAAFSETACKRLLAIASSGARCGVHLLIQRDLRQPLQDVALEDELRRTCLRVTLRDHTFHLAEAPSGADVVVFDPPPSLEDSITLVHRIG
ncbi:MAG: hypothetical protein EOP85_00545, partial [Verrucomicrobiaceae bacterium]